MTDSRLKIAVFIDFDNIEIGVKSTLGRQFDIGAVLEAIKERGEIVTKVAYGDWKRAGDYGRAMSQHAVRLVQRVMTPGGDKNGADINLALDALEMAFTHDHINAFVIVGGDSDFITLVEKLKQYDRKVFVVGGRAFTSQVMQKNCTEFIAYENVTTGTFPAQSERGDHKGSAPERRRGTPASRGREAAAPLDQALPLVKRALKVLADREVSPQLGLLKQTLLQLDSSFSERDYGVNSFRDFAERLEKQGLVTLKHSGRTTVVELAEEDGGRPATVAPSAAAHDGDGDSEEQAFQGNGRLRGEAASASHAGASAEAGNLAEGVALIRSILAESTTPPRWPMYVRQMKQFIRNARPDFDERKYGSILDLMRACQKDGLLRLERDRQGGLRVFATGPGKPSAVPHGWSTIGGDEAPAVMETAEPQHLLPAAPAEAELTLVAPEAKPKRSRRKADPAAAVEKPTRARSASAKAAADKKAAPKNDEPKPTARTRSRRSRASASTARAAAPADRAARDDGNR